jgi:hypothetical protein
LRATGLFPEWPCVPQGQARRREVRDVGNALRVAG